MRLSGSSAAQLRSTLLGLGVSVFVQSADSPCLCSRSSGTREPSGGTSLLLAKLPCTGLFSGFDNFPSASPSASTATSSKKQVFTSAAATADKLSRTSVPFLLFCSCLESDLACGSAPVSAVSPVHFRSIRHRLRIFVGRFGHYLGHFRKNQKL